jgi:uncharacterized protein involved in exopolysaccharide biosynthesis
VTLGPLDEYLRILEGTLRTQGIEPSRFMDEAREHLVDAVDEGLRRGLTREDAEREALERFGPPDLLASQVPSARSYHMARLTNARDVIIGNWRWMTAATSVAAVLAGAASYAVLPAFYRSESVISVVSQPERVPPSVDSRRDSHERMQSITTTILSDARLDPILKDLGLGTAPEVRRNINVMVTREQPEAGNAIGAFTVGFQSPDPKLSQKVTERLTSLLIMENLADAELVGRAIGDQFRVTKAPSLPTDAQRPGMAKMTVSGAFAGLALSIVALAWRKER